MKLRIALTMIVIFLYGVLFNLYIYELFRISRNDAAIFYNIITFGMLVFCVTDWKIGFVNAFHRQFNFIGFLCLMVNYLFIVLTRCKILINPLPMFLTFNSGIFAVTAMIMISGYRHKTFD